MTSVLKSDPTHTTTFRQLFVQQFRVRFKAIEDAITKSIVNNDCFGLKAPISVAAIDYHYNSPITKSPFGYQNIWKQDIRPIPNNAYRFDSNPKKVSNFMSWLQSMQEAGLFQVIKFKPMRSVDNPIWTSLYIQDAYKHGMLWGRQQIRKDNDLKRNLGITNNDVSVDDNTMNTAFNSPINADRVALVYTRTYEDLKGITSEMDAQISRILSEGMVKGEGPLVLARQIANRVEKLGIHRATLLARTEVIRAHHLASIQTYRDFGIEEIIVKAEWLTAGDSRVCETCAPLNGKIYSLNKVEGMIPVHPQCRCATIPYVEVKDD